MNRLDNREQKVMKLGSYMIKENNPLKAIQVFRIMNLINEIRLRDANISTEQRYKLLYEREKWINNLRSSN